MVEGLLSCEEVLDCTGKLGRVANGLRSVNTEINNIQFLKVNDRDDEIDYWKSGAEGSIKNARHLVDDLEKCGIDVSYIRGNVNNIEKALNDCIKAAPESISSDWKHYMSYIEKKILEITIVGSESISKDIRCQR